MTPNVTQRAGGSTPVGRPASLPQQYDFTPAAPQSLRSLQIPTLRDTAIHLLRATTFKTELLNHCRSYKKTRRGLSPTYLWFPGGKCGPPYCLLFPSRRLNGMCSSSTY
uniref:En/Spm-like transposon protein n=1 Tax=Arabidopsis thaliana TaxID=3702 RepID=Q9ZU61_ARATH|nr:En/Spm-like transposon protein [Arabidopsis thaliana]